MDKKLSKDELIKFVEDLKHQWMTTIDAIIDPLCIVNENYEIIKANKAMAKHGKYSHVKKTIGLKCHKVFAGRDTPCEGCKVHQAFNAKKPINYTLDINNKFFEVTSQPIIDREKKFSGVVQSYRDRTRSKKLQDQLLQSEKLASIGLLAGGVAHEINNPLGGILVFSQMLLREFQEESPHREDLLEIENAALRCREIVNRLLEFARHQPSETKRIKKPTALLNESGFTTKLKIAAGTAVYASMPFPSSETTRSLSGSFR